MRLQIFSDVHFDVSPGYEPRLAPGVDAVIVAGDLCEGIARGLGWLRHHLGPAIPIVFVAGNHEYFARVRPLEREAGVDAARHHGIAFLDDAEAIIGGVRLVGSTLWSDYALYGTERRLEMMDLARRRMMDHRRILEAPGRFITPEEQLVLHQISRAWLATSLARPHSGPTVVVTHHGPHPGSLAPQYRDDLLSAAFISDLSGLIAESRPQLWVHGHTHVSLDHRAGPTRIICNPHGYATENPAFDPRLVVEI
jgi:Icc-related predicted phosphoesterase